MMSLDDVIETMESRIYDLGQRLLTDPATRLREEVEALQAELRYAYAALSGHRRRHREARRRVAANEVRAALLASEAETAWLSDDRDAAWLRALELEEVRRALAADRAALPCLEHACRTGERRVADLERRLAPLQNKLFPV